VGNLQPEEGKMLDQVLQELRLNYVDESNKPATPPAPPASTEPPVPPKQEGGS